MTTAARKMNGKAGSHNLGELSDQIETLRKDLGQLTQSIAEMSKTKSEEVVETAQKKISDLREEAVDASETARLHALELQDKTTDFVKNRPATALGIVAGVGLLIAFMSMRK